MGDLKVGYVAARRVSPGPVPLPSWYTRRTHVRTSLQSTPAFRSACCVTSSGTCTGRCLASENCSSDHPTAIRTSSASSSASHSGNVVLQAVQQAFQPCGQLRRHAATIVAPVIIKSRSSLLEGVELVGGDHSFRSAQPAAWFEVVLRGLSILSWKQAKNRSDSAEQQT